MRRGAQSACLLVLIAVMLVYVRHSAHYFFLFDDFALIGQSRAEGIQGIWSSALFGFYRPLPFVLERGLFIALGATTAWPYAVFALLLHAVNSALVYALGTRLRLSRESALVAAVLFLLSASAAESYFWLSAIFDRMAVFGTLVMLVSGLEFCDAATPRRVGLFFTGGLLGAGIALLSKESGVIAPALFVTAVALRGRSIRLTRVVAFSAMLVVSVLTLLFIRHRVLPGLSGAYGDWDTLIRAGGVAGHVLTYLRTTIVMPLPHRDDLGLSAEVVARAPVLLTACWALLAVQALRVSARRSLLCVLSWTAAILPVVWMSLIPGSSAAGRLLYMPGIWSCLIVAIALEDRGESSPARSVVPWILACAAAVIVVLFQLGSVWFQSQIWIQASALSRSAIEQIRPYAGESAKLYIPNLPFWYIEGPYVLKDYAFSSFFGADFRPSVRARPMTLAYHKGETWFAGSASEFLKGPQAAGSDERTIELKLPIRVPIPDPQSQIVLPSEGVVLRQPFLVTGWAVDRGGASGCGVDTVHVYAHPATGSPIFFGAADYGSRDVDASKRFRSPFSRCGWSLPIKGLPPGAYSIVAHPHSIVSGTFTAASVVRIRVR
ncbi:MAG TPA: hypothetical protein VK595_00140 [Vicinamibacterales bacterium]|nr:hypothetical protein [Vicinamibacterales bacterium]